MDTPMMKCGHAANGTTSRMGGIDYDPPIPACVICSCHEQVPTPDMTGRKARCGYFGKPTRKNECSICKDICRCERDSDPGQLAFFKHCPDKPFDDFYCGCHSWD